MIRDPWPGLPAPAEWDEVLGFRVPARFGPLEDELAALREGCALLPAPWERLLHVTGADRKSFLHNLLTQKLDDLEVGRTVPAAQASRKGHLLADLWLTERGDRFDVRLQAPRVQTLLETWDRYRIVEEVEWSLVEPTAAFLAVGPRVGVWRDAQSAQEDDPWIAEFEVREITQHDRCVFLRAEDADSLRRKIEALSNDGRAVLVGWRAFDQVRIERGRAWEGLDAGEDRLVPEPGFDDRVHYQKGCYLGQETLARLHFRGGLAWSIARFTADPGAELEPGDELLDSGGKRIGWLTSVVPGNDGAPRALGYLHRRGWDSADPVRARSGTAVRVLASGPPR